MSHASGEVIVGDQIVGYFEYNGTCDVVTNRIQPTLEDVDKWWRTAHNNDAECTCNQPPTDVIIWSSYGGGFYWPGKACLTCHCIVAGFTPFGP